VPAIIDRLLVTFVTGHSLYLIGSVIWFLLFAFITLNELRLVLKQKEITRETISLSISIYLLIAFTWGLLYIVIYQVHPDAFNLGNLNASGAPAPTEQQVTPVLVYFSIITISTVGYGDILPMSLQARYAAAAEGIAGQFYLAILVARLVGIYMSKQTEQGGSNESSRKAE
jgi:amino acid transporter